MKYLREYFISVLIGSVFLGAFFGWLIVRALDDVHHRNTIEVNFRAACDAAKGQTVWNGRNWECLK